MASLLSIASFLAERVGRKTDYPFIRSLEDRIVEKRARLLANSLSKTNGRERFYLNKFKIDVTLVDLSDECETPPEPDCDEKAWKTVEPIPSPIEFGVHPFSYVGPVGGFHGFGWTTFAAEPYLRKRQIVGKHPRHTFSNNYIYIFNKELDEIQVEGVFPDPRKLAKFQSCSGNKPCWSKENEMFVEEQWAEIIIKDLLGGELRVGLPNDPVEIQPDKNV